MRWQRDRIGSEVDARHAVEELLRYEIGSRRSLPRRDCVNRTEVRGIQQMWTFFGARNLKLAPGARLGGIDIAGVIVG